jgi:hypothetical protein
MLTTNEPIQSPFIEKTGTSHGFEGIEIADLDKWWEYTKSNPTEQFIRLHPKQRREHSLNDNVQQICDAVNRAVYIYPDPDSMILTLNNWVFKVWDQEELWWDFELSTAIDPTKIYSNWPVDESTPIKDIPIWIKREFLSFYLMPCWVDQLEWDHSKVFEHDRCLLIYVNDILYNFTKTILRIQEFCGLEFKKDISDLTAYHNKMLELQKYLGHDALCNRVVNSTINHCDYDWSDQSLSLVDEAWIQWRLRELGHELRCDGLDFFPTNSVSLQKLLYSL